MENSSSDSAEQIGMNEDLITEILLKLPTRDVLKCKLVSKQWSSVISSTRFCLSHTVSLRTKAKGSLKPCALFITTGGRRPPSEIILLPLKPDARLPLFDFIHLPDVNILESSSGLLLCVSYKYELFHGTYFICNPTTRKFKILPYPAVKNFHYLPIALAFDPLKSPHYKVIYFALNAGSLESYIDIYSSETNSWRKLELTKMTCVDILHGVYFNGAVHWYGDNEESLYLEVDNECMKTMPMPKVNVNDVACRYFGESGGHLNLVLAHKEAPFTFSIFEMEDDHSNWYLKYSLNLEAEINTLWPGNCGAYLLISTIQSEEGDDSIVVAFPKGRAISYNLKNGTLQVLQCPSTKEFKCSKIRACQYFETLSCV